ncbi:MAG TPA: hypothetical protein DCX32_00830 [Candidatus Moranbacteria bacterium]|nr:MAG: hypothetical protein UW87_C0010G0004 [Candidatus Moranbacteria bacterium GW2011_GWC2_45_10]KKT94707.1 MAG: hypothetical protein UW95_C0010G0014 [Parcubacteria group bacterium GW2011_GWC1_45_14]HAV11082.1 hypothetical protein [Candidatus Moranbacteria bacterium]
MKSWKIVGILVFCAFLFVGCSNFSAEDKPSEEDISKAIIINSQGTPNMKHNKLKITSVVKIMNARYGNLDAEGNYPVTTLALAESNHGRIILWQEWHFQKELPEYGKSYWKGRMDFADWGEEAKWDLENFYATPHGHWLAEGN